MKKIISILLSILIIIPGSVTLAADSYTAPVNEITKEEAYQFADELKEMNKESSDSSLRLIVNADKKIDYLDAISTATGIDDLYILQFDNKNSLEKAEEYYNSLDYVNYTEHDFEMENPFCSVDEESDYNAQCPSTVNQNIDDAIKLLNQENIEIPEIRIGVIDSGIAKTKITESRLDGGYSYLENHSTNGTQDGQGHGTEVAGSIILNTLDYVRLYSYQIFDGTEYSATMSNAISAIYLAVADNCKIINCSFLLKEAKKSDAMISAINFANSQNIIIVCAAGNYSENLNGNLYYYPAMATNCITVGATTPENRLASFSNFGDGVDIYAVGNLMTSYNTSGNKVNDFGGTSGAAPVISSICALLVTAKPDITVDEIKQLLLETGYSTNEENQTHDTRIIADAYGCVKNLLGAELEQLRLDYNVEKNNDSNFAEISFACDDPNANIYYQITEVDRGSVLATPFTHAEILYNSYKYEPGTAVRLKKYQNIVACAYAPGRAKSNIQYFLAPDFSYQSGYRLTTSSKTQQYNMITRCNIIDEKVITIPEFIDGAEIQEIGPLCFMGNKGVETIILPESVKQIDEWAFANCPNLKIVIAPGVENCGRYAFYQCGNLVNVEIPNITVANTGMFKNCKSLETAKLGTLTEIDNHAFYSCENLKLVKTTADDISFAINTFKDCSNLTIYTPSNSSMEKYAVENDISLLGDVQDNGGSIRVTDAGLRFGYQYNGEENKNIEEYGFVYNSGETDNLTVDNSLKLVANNRIDHGKYTTYNLVFTDVPYTKKAFNQMISAKAYIKIGGEYFYSDVIQHSYNTIANAVLNDETIDSNTKNAVQNILDKVA